MDKGLGYRSELRRDSAGDPNHIKGAAWRLTPDERPWLRARDEHASRVTASICRASVIRAGTKGASSRPHTGGTEGNSMTMQVVWHGTQQESFDLVNAIARNCTCEFGLMGVRLATCAPHRMLTEDQRALNGLLFARRMCERLRREEFSRARSANSGRSRSNGLTSIAAD